MVEGLAGIRPFQGSPVGSFLTLNTTRRPGDGGEAFRTDRLFAVEAGSETSVLNPLQRRLHLTQQGGLAIDVPDRQIAFRRKLDLVHLIRTLLDGYAFPVPQYLSQFGLFCFEDLLEPVFRGCLHASLLSWY